MRALIVDDHSVMRTGMRTLLEKTEGMTVVGEASTGPEAVQLARATRPDYSSVRSGNSYAPRSAVPSGIRPAGCRP